jgi:2-polyprenyl-6-methoxyphenol hydroxylase-like FAD-dependent oxidoreductase
MLLARRGLSVLLVDRGRYGSDTLSTHALMRAGVVQLHRWSVLDRIKAAGTPAVRTTSFHYADEVVEVRIKPRDGMDGLYAPRRTVIDAALVDAAREAGAAVAFETRLIDLVRREDGRVSGARLHQEGRGPFEAAAGLVIGADGVRSSVARLAGADCYKIGRYATGVIFSYWRNTGHDGYHWHYRPGVSAGVIPTNAGLTCVFVSVSQDRFHEEVKAGAEAAHRKLLNECDVTLAATVARCDRAERLSGFSGELGFFRQSHGPGWALIGDAGYFKDPLTAHGITDALVDAEVLSDAVASGSEGALAEYQRARDARATKLFDVTDAIASFQWDLTSVQQLHLALSEEMKKETLGVMR